MPSYSFICARCSSKFETKAMNAKYCQKKECQKYRKDLTRKPKSVFAGAPAKHNVIKAAPQKHEVAKASKKQEPIKKQDFAKPREVINPSKKQENAKPETLKTEEKKPEKNVIKPNQFTEVERVNDHIIIIRTKGPKCNYIPDAILRQNGGTIKKAPEELEPDFETIEDLEDLEED